jgi:hypothetical protein
MQTFAIATTGHVGMTPGEIYAATDTQGSFRSFNGGLSWQPCNDGIGQVANGVNQAALRISKVETTGGISAIYTACGDGGAGGGLLVSSDKMLHWAVRSTAVQFAGNHGINNVDYPRSTGRLIEEDTSFLYVGTYAKGVARSASQGADDFPVTFTATGSSGYVRAVFLDSGGTLWVGFYPLLTSKADGGLWKCVSPHAAQPVLTQVTIPTAAQNEVEDIFVTSDGVVYIACGNQGIYSSAAGSGGTWGPLNSGIDTSAGNSSWTSLDGYVDANNNHVIIAGCSNGIKNPAGSSHIENSVMIIVPSHGTGTPNYIHYLSNQSTVAYTPVPGYGASWNAASGLCIAQQGFKNPFQRFDPNDATHKTVWAVGSMGPAQATNVPTPTTTSATAAWQMSNNAYSAFLGHCPAADPNHPGWMVFGDSDWGGWKVLGDGMGATGEIVRNGGLAAQNFCHAYDPFTSEVWSGSGPKYCNPNSGGKIGKQAWNASGVGTAGWTDTGYTAGNCVLGLLVIHQGDVASGQQYVIACTLNGGIWKYNGTSWVQKNTVFGTKLNGSGTTTGLRYPIVYDGLGVIYAWDRLQAVFRSTDYGETWTPIFTVTSSDMGAGELACNPTNTGELWVSSDTGDFYQLTGAESGTVGGGGITKTNVNFGITSGQTGSLVGATVNIDLPTNTQNTHVLSANYFDNCFPSAGGVPQYPFAYSAQKIYYQNNTDGSGVFPTSFIDGSGNDISGLVSAGCQIWICYQPNPNFPGTGGQIGGTSADLANFITSVQWWLNHHPNGANGIRVIPYQEPQNSNWGFSSTTYQQTWHYYAPSLQALTDPLGRHCKVVYDAAGHSLTTAANGGNACTWLTAIINGGDLPDEVVIDFYGSSWESLTSGGTTNLDPVAPLRSIALAHNLKFGYGEIGVAEGTNPYTPSLTNTYIAYIGTSMLAVPPGLRTAAMWYNADKGSPNQNTVTIGSPLVAPLEQLWNTLTTPSVDNNGPIAFDAAGNLYMATQDLGSGCGLFYLAGPSPDPLSDLWISCEPSGDQSFSQSNCAPEVIAIGPESTPHLYVAGSNTVTQGFNGGGGGGGASATFSEVQGSANITGAAGTLALVLPGASTAGTLLVARIACNDPTQTITAPAGWKLVGDNPQGTGTNAARATMFVYEGNPGSITTASFTYSNTGSVIKGRIHEYTTSPSAGIFQFVDQPAAYNGAAASGTSFAVTEASTNAYTGGLGLGMVAAHLTGTLSGQTWTLATGWSSDGTANNASVIFAMLADDVLPSGPSSFTETAALGSATMTAWAALLVTFTAIVTTPLSVATSSLPPGMVTRNYHQQLLANGGNAGGNSYTWSITAGSLPAGLGLSTGGMITGTPTGTGTSSFTAQVQDQNGQTATANLSITVAANLVITTSATLPGGVTGTPYSASQTTTGGTAPDTWTQTAGSRPATIALSASTGALTGTPSGPGVFSFTLTVTDVNGFTASQAFTLTIIPGQFALFDDLAIVDSLVVQQPVSNNAQPADPLAIVDSLTVAEVQMVSRADVLAIQDNLTVSRPGTPPWTLPFVAGGTTTSFVTSLSAFEAASPQIGQQFQIYGPPGLVTTQIFTITSV